MKSSMSFYDDDECFLPRPPPPIVGKVTHYNLELYWDETLRKAYEDVNVKEEGRIRICLQEQDKHGNWGNIYSGYGKSHTVTGLDPTTEYRYRMRFMNNKGNGDWSPHVVVSTTKEPLNGEHLHRAIVRQDLAEIERVLESGDVQIDVPDKYGFSGLMQASQKGFIDIVELLLKYGADVNAQNDAGKTALMLSCFAGQLEVVKLLREKGARYDVYDKGGSTAMHWAVDGQNNKLVEWMIKDGADVNIKDHNSHWTPLLRCAAVSGNRDVALTLLIAGADINARDKDGKTALMIAIINNHQNLMELLLKRNADLLIKNEYGKTAYDMAISMEKRRIVKSLTEHLEKQGIKMHY